MDERAIIQTIRDNPDGCTVGLDGRHYYGGGYVVGGKVAPLVAIDLTYGKLSLWLAKLPHDVEYIGSWADEGQTYVDAVDIIADLAEAEALAKARGELAFYDAYEGKVVDLR